MRGSKKRLGILTVLLIAFISIVSAIAINYVGVYKHQDNIEGKEVDKGVFVHFINVGQGDCELILDNGKTVLIDGGEKEMSSKVKSYLNKLHIKEIDYMIATHPHSDHVGGLSEQIQNFKVNNLIIPNIPKAKIPTTKVYVELLNAANSKNVNVIEAKPGCAYNLDRGTLKILGPIQKEYNGLNSYSVAAKYECEGKAFLFCGDMEKDAEKDMIESGQDISADVFKLNHHGSNTSNTKLFLDSVDPKFCVIEVGKNNKYNLPSNEVIERIKGKTVYRTDRDGDVTFKIENGIKVQTKN